MELLAKCKVAYCSAILWLIFTKLCKNICFHKRYEDIHFCNGRPFGLDIIRRWIWLTAGSHVFFMYPTHIRAYIRTSNNKYEYQFSTSLIIWLWSYSEFSVVAPPMGTIWWNFMSLLRMFCCLWVLCYMEVWDGTHGSTYTFEFNKVFYLHICLSNNT